VTPPAPAVIASAPSLADLIAAAPDQAPAVPSTPTDQVIAPAPTPTTTDTVTDSNNTDLSADTPAPDTTTATTTTSTPAPVVQDTGVADQSTAPAPAPVVPDPVKPVLPIAPGTPIAPPQPAPAPVSSGPTGIPSVDAILAKVPTSMLGPIITIKNYMEMMKPGRPMDPKVGAANQVNLYRAMMSIVTKDTEHFEALFTAMLRMFEHGAQGVFHELYVYRFAEHVVLNPEEIKAWQKMINLFKVMGPVDGRDLARRAVSIEQSVSHLAENAKNRILAYFSPTGR